LKDNSPHIPVLYNEVLETFSTLTDGYIIDCTLGYAGHSFGIISTNDNIKLICNDQDDTALEFSKQRLDTYSSRVIFNKGNFKNIIEKFKDKEIRGILADIGVSSLQLDNRDRGFGFKSDTLDMRMDQTQSLSAKDVINDYNTKDLEYILKEYGEVKEYKKVANLIVQNRPFNSSLELSQLLEQNMYNNGKLHPATLPFQAIRIEVNQELTVLQELFDSIKEANLTNCLVAIISFHSLEDRIVKTNFKAWSKKCICPDYIMRCECGNNNQLGKIITKKPIIPTKKEIKTNARSRSSKMRIFEIK
jgi:16S rRNA (cytosine1402-N4)-methyltransferase